MHTRQSQSSTPLTRIGRFLGMMLIGLLTAYPTMSTAALPDNLKMVGAGELKWLGLRIYEASLWTSDGDFRAIRDHQNVALVIDYARNIPRARLVDSARTEWARIGLQDPRTEAWCREVAAIWPDVRPGDRITSLVERDGPTHFFFNGQAIGSIADPDFGPALLEIWLHPNSRSERLRVALTGETT